MAGASCDLCQFGHDARGIVWVQPFSLTPENREKLEERLQIDALSQQMLEQCVLGQNIASDKKLRNMYDGEMLHAALFVMPGLTSNCH